MGPSLQPLLQDLIHKESPVGFPATATGTGRLTGPILSRTVFRLREAIHSLYSPWNKQNQNLIQLCKYSSIKLNCQGTENNGPI